MDRWLLACVGVLGLAGCLEPEDPLYPRRDTDPPEVSATEPAAGVTIGRTAELRITFSERMDERTLRPGIAVFAGREEVALGLTVPPRREGEEDVERGDEPYTVTASAAEGTFEPNTSYTLVLRTSLTDDEGNALVDEVRVPFRTGP